MLCIGRRLSTGLSHVCRWRVRTFWCLAWGIRRRFVGDAQLLTCSGTAWYLPFLHSDQGIVTN